MKLARLHPSMIVLLLASPLACQPPASTNAQARGIIGGQPSPGDDTVFMISFSVLGIPNMCSATLISERTLLTAAHCLDTRYYPGGSRIQFRATNQADASSGASGQEIDIVDVRIHPTYGVLNGRNDVALALLARTPIGVTPKPWTRSDTRQLVGASVRALGYGFTDPEDYWSYGLRSEVDLTIQGADDHFFFIGDGQGRGFCNGDSGGPSFHLFPDGIERLVGVHAAGETCDEGRDVRVDLHADFIDAWLLEKEGTRVEPIEPVEPVEPIEPVEEETPDAAVAEAAVSIDAVDEAPDAGSADAGQRASHDGSAADAEGEEDEIRVLREVSSCRAMDAPSGGEWAPWALLLAFWVERRLRVPSRVRPR